MRPNHHSPDVDRKNDRIFAEIVTAVSPQPPTYKIRQVTEHCWVLYRWNAMEQLYEFPFPVASHCRTESEALAWMQADAKMQRVDISKLEPLIDAPALYYNADGEQVPHPTTPIGSDE